MIPEWVVEEFQTVDLGDTRRDDRLIKVLADLVSQPTVSLPAADARRSKPSIAYSKTTTSTSPTSSRRTATPHWNASATRR